VVCGDAKCILTQRAINHSARLYFFLHSKCQAEVCEQLKSLTHNEKLGGPDPILDAKRLLTSPEQPQGLKGVPACRQTFLCNLV
jgi:hypothetical protein